MEPLYNQERSPFSPVSVAALVQCMNGTIICREPSNPVWQGHKNGKKLRKALDLESENFTPLPLLCSL